MTEKRFILICLIIGLLLITPISAKEIIVDEKRIECGGCLNTPYFVIGQNNLDHNRQKFVIEEYVVSAEQYYKINVGDKITLSEQPSMTGLVDVIKIN